MKLTKAQTALHKKMGQILEEIGKPITKDGMATLENLLKANKHDSLWGLAIRRVFNDDGDKAKLITMLADQAMDDPFTMQCIVGMDATILLLRTIKN